MDAWERLNAVVANSRLAVFVGAGMSIPSCIPKWSEFTAEMSNGLLSQETVSSLHSAGIPFEAQLSLARQGCDEATWTDRCRQVLYRGFQVQLQASTLGLEDIKDIEKEKCDSRLIARFFKETNPALYRVLKLCTTAQQNSVRRNQRIGALLTTNLDSLLQFCDRAMHGCPRMLRTIERSTKYRQGGKVPLYHLHGYVLPWKEDGLRKEAPDRLVLTESEYLARNDNPYHWASATMHWACREYSVLFVGCSMTDPLVRRALMRTRHERLGDAAAESQRQLAKHSTGKHFAVFGRVSSPALASLIEQSNELIDVNTLWVEEFEADLPNRLRALRDHLGPAG